MKRILPLSILALILTGCGVFQQQAAAPPPPEPQAVVAAPYHENALYNFHLGRSYMAQGRYELARERYLLALACSHDDDLRLRAAQELEAAQRQIESLR